MQMEDLRNWSKGMARCTEALKYHAKKIRTFDNIVDDEKGQFDDDPQDVEIIVKLLRFLSILLKAGSDKRYFLFFEVIIIQLPSIVESFLSWYFKRCF